MEKVKKVEVKDGERLVIVVPEGNIACFKWDGHRSYEMVLMGVKK